LIKLLQPLIGSGVSLGRNRYIVGSMVRQRPCLWLVP